MKRALVLGLLLGACSLALADTPVGTCSTSSAKRVSDGIYYLPDAGWNYQCCGSATFTDGGPIVWAQGNCSMLFDQAAIPLTTSKTACTTQWLSEHQCQ